jgi:predicted phosphodiesterase
LSGTARIAIIADIHGELSSLEAVLAEIEQLGIEHIVCLGDVSGLGPNPHEVLVRVRELGCPVVRGNADEFLLNPSLIAPETNPDADAFTRRLHAMERWGLEQLTPEDIEFVQTFQATVEIPLDDGRSLLCYHGSPRSAWDEIKVSTPGPELSEKLGDHRAAVMAGGHTHEQFLRRLGATTVINPGSVGLPWEELPDGSGHNPSWADYAVITATKGRLSIDLRRVPVDAAVIRHALVSSGMPHAEAWAADRR